MKTLELRMATAVVAIAMAFSAGAATAAPKDDKAKTGVTGSGASNPNANAGGNDKEKDKGSTVPSTGLTATPVNSGGGSSPSGGGVTIVQTGGNAPTLTAACASIVSGCLFGANDNEKYAETIRSLYNAQAPVGAPTITSLSFIGKLDGGAAGLTGSSGAWTSPAPATFVSVKAGDGFFLYALEKVSTSGMWSTAALGSKELSHLSLWAGAVHRAGVVRDEAVGGWDDYGNPMGGVPEPATWAMMIGGFALVGSSLRRRRALKAGV